MLNKRLVFLLRILLALIVVCLCVTGCERQTPKEEHTHIYQEQNTGESYLYQSASCTEAAKYYYSCSCGEKGEDTFPFGDVAPHNFSLQLDEASYLASEATCTASAFYFYTCSACGAVSKDTFSSGTPLGHDFSLYLSNGDATENEDGTETATCSRCQITDTRIDVGSKLSHVHSFTEKVVTNEFFKASATCQTPSTYFYSCACGRKGTTTFTSGSLANHTFSNYVSNGDATCTSDGTKTARCSYCSARDTIIDPGSMLNHTYEKKVANASYLCSKADCITSATYFYSCVCGKAGTTIFSHGYPLGHRFSDYASNQDATCTSDGTKTRTCLRCSVSETTTDIGSKLPHTFTNQIIIDTYRKSAADCQKPAEYYYACSCGAKGTDTYSYGNALGHDYVPTKTLSSPTLTTDGLRQCNCTRCQDTKTISIPKIDSSKYYLLDYVVVKDNKIFDSHIPVNKSTSLALTAAVMENDFTSPYVLGSIGEFTFRLNEKVWNVFLSRSTATADNSNRLIYILSNEYVQIMDVNNHVLADSNISIQPLPTGYASFILGGSRDSTGTIQTGSLSVAYYEVSLWQGQELVMELIPVQKYDGGQIGFYDTISDSFLTEENGETSLDYPHNIQFEVQTDPIQNDIGSLRCTCTDCGLSYTQYLMHPDSNEYEPIEYYDSYGYRYLDTGFQLTVGESAALSLDLQYTEAFSGYFGANYLMEIDYSAANTLERVQMLAKHDASHNLIYRNGTLVRDRDVSSMTYRQNEEIYLFLLGDMNDAIYRGALQEPAHARVFGGSLLINGKLVSYYVPMKRLADGEEGLYDMVRNVFLVSESGKDDITAFYHTWTVENTKLPTKDENGIICYTCCYCGLSYEEKTGKIDTDKYTLIDAFVSDGHRYVDTGLICNRYDAMSIQMDIEISDIYYNWMGANYYLEVSSERIGTGRKDVRVEYTSFWNEIFLDNQCTHQELYGLQYDGVDVEIILMALGNANRDLWNNGLGVAGILYSAQVFNNYYELLGNYLPACRNSDGEIGLYDTITETFLPNCGTPTHTFTTSVVYKEPTATTNGIRRYICEDCGFFIEESIDPVDTSIYEVLPYIDAPSSCYIDTGIVASNGFAADYRAIHWGYVQPIGAHNENEPYGRNYVLYGKDPFWLIGTGDSYEYMYKKTQTPGGLYYVQESTVNGNRYLVVNGQTFYSSDGSDELTSNPLLLFQNQYLLTLWDDPTNVYTQGTLRLFYMTVYDDCGNKVLSITPVRRKTDGVVGFYDSVSGRLLEAQGTSPLSAPQTTPISDYSILDSIDFLGDSFVDVGVYSEGVWTIDMKFNATDCEQIMGYSSQVYNYFGIYQGQFYATGNLGIKADTLRHTFIFKYYHSDRRIWIDGEITSKQYAPMIHDSFCIGGCSNLPMGTVSTIYSVQFSINGKTIFEYIPVRRNSDGVLGFYETNEGCFFPVQTYQQQPTDDYFTLPSTAYQKELAVFTAKLSHQSYEGLPNSLENYGFSLVSKYYDITDSQGETDTCNYKLYKKYQTGKDGQLTSTYILYISGTSGTENWLSNATVNTTSSGFHEGFEKGADFVLSRVIEFVQKDPEHNRIIITGHSRGSAVGAILAAKLMEQSYFYQENTFVYVYACPNYSTRGIHYDNIFVINNQGDIVPQIPPTQWGFTNEGQTIILSQDANVMSLLNQYLSEYQESCGETVVGYSGLTNVDEILSLMLEIVPSASVLSSADNQAAIAEILQFMGGGTYSDATGLAIAKLALQNGGFITKLRLAALLIANKNAFGPSHFMVTYYHWVLAQSQIM